MKRTLTSQKMSSSAKTKKTHVKADVVIIGGGPAGLAFAASLRKTNLKLCLIEKQNVSSLAQPTFDGRDIALTHSAMRILKDLGIYSHIPETEISPIREARVVNGTSPYFLNFDSRDEGKDALGYLISNHVVRQAAYAAVKSQKNLEIITDEVKNIVRGKASNTVFLSKDIQIEAPLLIAADSRFSGARRMMGIPTSMRDFGRSVVVFRVEHEKQHHNTAFECFHYERTLAILPLQERTSSIVITLPSDKVASLNAMTDEALAQDICDRFGGELGAMKLITQKHTYPLVATYADQFVSSRFALIGDAAVGMHPVTAHGYNFGLYGVHNLAAQISDALELGLDIGNDALLETYNQAHRRATMGIYHGTNAVVRLFTDERPIAKFARAATLRLGNWIMPAKTLITRQLTQDGAMS